MCLGGDQQHAGSDTLLSQQLRVCAQARSSIDAPLYRHMFPSVLKSPCSHRLQQQVPGVVEPRDEEDRDHTLQGAVGRVGADVGGRW